MHGPRRHAAHMHAVCARIRHTHVRALVGVLALTHAHVARAQTADPMRFGVVITPDTVRVGDPFIMKASVEVPAGAHVTWPVFPDSGSPITMRTGIKVSGAEGGSTRRETAEYRLAAWSVGSVPLTLGAITVSSGTADTVTIPFTAPPIVVETVLPADTSLRVPKPAKALFPRIVPWWEAWWPALVVLLLLVILGYVVYRYRHRAKAMLELDPFARAIRDFQRLDRLALGDAGEQGRFVALAVEVMRTYLSIRVPQASLALTSEELMRVVADDSRVPVQRLAPLLIDADAIKFGQQPVSALAAKEYALEARGLVSAVEQAEQARVQAARVALKAESKKQKAARLAAEDEARQKSRRNASEAA